VCGNETGFYIYVCLFEPLPTFQKKKKKRLVKTNKQTLNNIHRVHLQIDVKLFEHFVVILVRYMLFIGVLRTSVRPAVSLRT